MIARSAHPSEPHSGEAHRFSVWAAA